MIVYGKRILTAAYLDELHAWLDERYPDGDVTYTMAIPEDHLSLIAESSIIEGGKEKVEQRGWERQDTLVRATYLGAYRKMRFYFSGQVEVPTIQAVVVHSERNVSHD